MYEQLPPFDAEAEASVLGSVLVDEEAMARVAGIVSPRPPAIAFQWGRVILDLCSGSKEWSRPYAEAGYHVIPVDLPRDVRLVRRDELPEHVHGVLAAPPCTEFSRAGAWLWARKGQSAVLEGLSVADACLRIVTITRPVWWALENPIGRLSDYLGEPVFKFDPCDFGDAWTKRTWLWGSFRQPAINRVAPTEVDRTTKKLNSKTRSVTPAGFARAFFEANP